jgi:hypothetical protein
VVKQNRNELTLSQLDLIEDIYKKMKPYLSGQKGLVIAASREKRSPFIVTFRQILHGEKSLDQLISKNIYPEIDLLPDTQVDFNVDKSLVEKTIVALWADYYKIVILVEEWEEEFWRAVARSVNFQVTNGQKEEWLTVPAIKRKRPISYQNLSRFELYNTRNVE